VTKNTSQSTRPGLELGSLGPESSPLTIREALLGVFQELGYLGYKNNKIQFA